MGVVDSEHAHSGSKALHVSQLSTQQDGYLLQWHDLPASTQTIYERAFFFVPAASTGNVALFNIIENGSPYESVRVLLSGNTLTLHDAVGTVTEASAARTLPVGVWTCIEWEIVQMHTGSLTMWLNDQQVALLPGDTRPANNPLGIVSVGAIADGAITAPFELWVDDVIVDDQRITCAQ
jgi:hypothetical protein